MKSAGVRGVVWVVCVSVALSGCAAMTRTSFQDAREGMSDVSVCRAHAAAVASGDATFVEDAVAELAKRALSPQDCPYLIKEANDTLKKALIAVAAVALVVAAARSGGGGGGAPAGGTDYSWQWDQQHNQFMQAVWVCRGEQTGQYAELYRCSGKPQSDYRWPGLGR